MQIWSGVLLALFSALIVCSAQDECKTKVTFNMDGLLDDAPIEEIRECGKCNCPGPLTCEFCQFGIDGNLCRPNGTVWCGGCCATSSSTSGTTGVTSSGSASTAPVENNCSQCIFAGPGNSLLCTPVMAEQQLGYFSGQQDVSSDKILSVNILRAYILAWVDGLTALADAGGADDFVFQSLSGAPLIPQPSAFSQLDYDAAQLQSSNIVWSASLLNVTQPEDEAALAALFVDGLRGRWRSASNPELVNDFLLPLDVQGSPRDLTTLPVLELEEYEGVCKTNMCNGQPGTVVVPPIIIGIRT